jgi:hypothetical protein
MATTDMTQLPALGEQGEPCAACGAPLAADQRYCLNCGRRRADARVEYRRLLAPPPAGGPGQAQTGAEAGEPPAAPPASPSRRESSPLIAVGGIAVLGLMLLVGVLIGRGDGGGTVTTATPVVQAEGSATAEETGGGGEESAKGGSSEAKGEKGGGADAKTASAGGGGTTGDEPVEASDEFLEDLSSKSGDDYNEASANLPDTLALPGEPPPKDNKEPGGGSEGTVIK